MCIRLYCLYCFLLPTHYDIKYTRVGRMRIAFGRRRGTIYTLYIHNILYIRVLVLYIYIYMCTYTERVFVRNVFYEYAMSLQYRILLAHGYKSIAYLQTYYYNIPMPYYINGAFIPKF